jgi:hypothetical protein
LSEIRATTISDAAGTGPIDLTGQSAAKAWVNFNGTGTVAIRDSLNVSSLTDVGVGLYTINLANSFSSASIEVSGGAGSTAVNAGYEIIFYAANLTPTSPSSSQIPVKGLTSTGSSISDLPYFTMSTHGDLA